MSECVCVWLCVSSLYAAAVCLCFFVGDNGSESLVNTCNATEWIRNYRGQFYSSKRRTYKHASATFKRAGPIQRWKAQQTDEMKLCSDNVMVKIALLKWSQVRETDLNKRIAKYLTIWYTLWYVWINEYMYFVYVYLFIWHLLCIIYVFDFYRLVVSE